MKKSILAILLLFSPWVLFAGDFSAVTAGRVLQFPRDHGAHREFKTEWWYFTGHLHDATGQEFGFQWTVFRTGLLPPEVAAKENSSAWRSREIYFGHLALSDLKEKKFYFGDSAARGAMGLAESSEKDFAVRLPGFKAEPQGDKLNILGQRANFAMDLQMPWPVPVVLHGDQGFSPKSQDPSHASYYYSIPRLPVQGKIEVAGKERTVEGEAWMDHEFSSSNLAENQSGWDWMGLGWGKQQALMLYRLRDQNDPAKDFLAGTFVDAQGTPHRLEAKDISLKPGRTWKSSESKASYPIEWEVSVPSQGIQLEVKANFPEQELDTKASTQIRYWEGSVQITGKQGDSKVEGAGYLEMTGYAGRFEKKI